MLLDDNLGVSGIDTLTVLTPALVSNEGLNPHPPTKVTTGFRSTSVITADGFTYSWGSSPQAGPGGSTPIEMTPEGATPFTEFSSWDQHVIALNEEGQWYAWGEASSGRLGKNSEADCEVPCLVLTLTGRVGTGPVAVGGGHTVIADLANKGDLVMFGSNSEGQCGQVVGTPFYSSLVTATIEDETIVEVFAGRETSFALTDNGDIYAWGREATTGAGNAATPEIPTVPSIWESNAGTEQRPLIKSVASASAHTLYLDVNNRVWIVGNSPPLLSIVGVLTAPRPYLHPVLTNITAVAAGTGFSVALSENGTVWTWGVNSHGQLGGGQSIGVETTTPYAIPAESFYGGKDAGFYGVPTAISAGTTHVAIIMDGPCPSDCSGAGTCNVETGECSCEFGIGGEACDDGTLRLVLIVAGSAMGLFVGGVLVFLLLARNGGDRNTRRQSEASSSGGNDWGLGKENNFENVKTSKAPNLANDRVLARLNAKLNNDTDDRYKLDPNFSPPADDGPPELSANVASSSNPRLHSVMYTQMNTITAGDADAYKLNPDAMLVTGAEMPTRKRSNSGKGGRGRGSSAGKRGRKRSHSHQR